MSSVVSVDDTKAIVTFLYKHKQYIFGFCILILLRVAKLGSKELEDFVYYEKNDSLIYILQWTNSNTIPFIHLRRNQTTYFMKNCPMQNCLMTTEKKYIPLKQFDAILFYGPHLMSTGPSLSPRKGTKQSYIFVSLETPIYYPQCLYMYQKYFNLTWTYKLNSDIVFNYFVVRNKSGQVIGPKAEMHWIKEDEMLDISDDIREKLQNKSKTTAWFVSNCKTKSKREDFVNELQKELKHYGLAVDIYGDCGTKVCNISNDKGCWQMIEREYFFYLSFENSFSEDYVTEKLLNPLRHYTIPIVYGGANYTRFIPPGIYLNAVELGPKNLAKKMFEISSNKTMFESFFRWHRYYSYHASNDSSETDPSCKLCEYLNNVKNTNSNKVYNHFRTWWNGPTGCSEIRRFKH